MTKLTDLTFESSSEPEVLKAIGVLRSEVWREEGLFPDFGESNPDCWLDDRDPTAYHWIVRHNDELVAAARMTIHNKVSEVPDAEWFSKVEDQVPIPVASLNRMVVRQEYRALGIAKALDDIRLKAAQEAKVKSVIGIAVGRSRLKALESLGFIHLFYLPEGHGLMVPETLHTAICKKY